ncbi:phage repressor protein CI [Erwinia sp. Eh17-17]|uniref:phage repressor protein CI n=1 Tax=Erwinia sp. Eh17-17 TaxID=3080330 RepID=UPI0032088145
MERSTKDFTNRKAPVLPEGGKEPIERMLQAYGFSSRQVLCRHLDVSQSTMANRIMRGNFPADWVLICSMETGASLEWLTYGRGAPQTDGQTEAASWIECIKITNGVKSQPKWVVYDAALLPDDVIAPQLIMNERITYIVDASKTDINDGFWLIEIDDVVSIRELYRFPGNRIRVENGKASFDCQLDDIKALGKVILRTEQV